MSEIISKLGINELHYNDLDWRFEVQVLNEFTFTSNLSSIHSFSRFHHDLYYIRPRQ